MTEYVEKNKFSVGDVVVLDEETSLIVEPSVEDEDRVDSCKGCFFEKTGTCYQTEIDDIIGLCNNIIFVKK